MSESKNTAVGQSIEIAVRLGVIFLIVLWCVQIIMPFVSLIVWGGIIAVAIYSPFLSLAKKLGGRKKLAAVFIALISIAIILVPVVALTNSLVDSSTSLGEQVSKGTLTISPPSEEVKSWPLVGEKAYTFWREASENLGDLLNEYKDQISTVGVKLLSAAAGIGVGILQFMISMLIAAAFLTSAEALTKAMKTFARRMAGDRGEQMLTLSTATVRSVAVGVIGIAFIQSVMGGLGMMLADVPAAGLFALIILVLAIAQLPPILILGPISIYVFSEQTTTVAFIFLAWSIFVSVSDMFLKPLLLGRGVDAPMLVILLGAIGGMIMSGIVGLFVGAVVLALGYTLLREWIMMDDSPQKA
ncbi:MAG: AI-2E family transporter [gamma proteobacterium symbiont of Bathyaustriella thionipta]|nr:AI-2E family transporter [gamma proteobacterium symbiont of Bathyaustriella thionipta]